MTDLRKPTGGKAQRPAPSTENPGRDVFLCCLDYQPGYIVDWTGPIHDP